MNRRTPFQIVLTGLCGAALLLGLSACKPAPPVGTAPQFDAKETKALEQLAEAGDPLEKYKLGKKFRDGDTVVRDLTNAAAWFRKSAEGGYAKGQYQLGLAYEEGQGVPKDPAEAVKWYTKASEQDNGNAQERLGFLVWKGEGAPKDLVQAHKWLALATANGEGKAAKGLKKIEVGMTPQQITEAKKLAAAFIPKKDYKEPEKAK
jgi:TPR repeat protein